MILAMLLYVLFSLTQGTICARDQSTQTCTPPPAVFIDEFASTDQDCSGTSATYIWNPHMWNTCEINNLNQGAGKANGRILKCTGNQDTIIVEEYEDDVHCEKSATRTYTVTRNTCERYFLPNNDALVYRQFEWSDYDVNCPKGTVVGVVQYGTGDSTCTGDRNGYFAQTILETDQSECKVNTTVLQEVKYDDFSSQNAMTSNGWSFSSSNGAGNTGGFWFIQDGSGNRNTFCNGIPATSYCGFANPGDLTLELIMPNKGTIVVDFENQWESGELNLVRTRDDNAVQLATVGTGERVQDQSYDVEAGDIISFVEANSGVARIHKFEFTAEYTGPYNGWTNAVGAVTVPEEVCLDGYWTNNVGGGRCGCTNGQCADVDDCKPLCSQMERCNVIQFRNSGGDGFRCWFWESVPNVEVTQCDTSTGWCLFSPLIERGEFENLPVADEIATCSGSSATVHQYDNLGAKCLGAASTKYDTKNGACVRWKDTNNVQQYVRLYFSCSSEDNSAFVITIFWLLLALFAQH